MYKINEKYPNYKIYDNGIITDLNDKPLKVFTSGKGYLYVNFYVNKKTKIVFIHRLVAYMFWYVVGETIYDMVNSIEVCSMPYKFSVNF